MAPREMLEPFMTDVFRGNFLPEPLGAHPHRLQDNKGRWHDQCGTTDPTGITPLRVTEGPEGMRISGGQAGGSFSEADGGTG